MITAKDIIIKELNKSELVPDLLEHFNRYQEVIYVWRIINGEKTLIKNPFVECWDEQLKREIVSEDLTNCINSGGAVYAAFLDNKLIAFASVPLDFFGSEKQYLQLMQLHVSHEYRGLGLGRRLFFLCANKAKELGAKKLYISTHSSAESQAFYQAVGCVDAQEINQALAEHEPYDFQLEYPIGHYYMSCKGVLAVKNRLILVEGIPGSGKTTIARKVKEYLESKGVKAKLYNEGDAHPADLAWIACIPLGEYEELLKSNPEQADLIRSYTQFGEGYALVAYLKIGFSSQEDPLLKYFEAHEVYSAKASTETFEALHLIRWEQFAKDIHNEEVAIFECAYLQNHINELMGFHNKDTDYITAYLMKLIHTVKNLDPKLIYLSQPDIEETIDRVAKERVTSDKTRWEDWIDRVIRYVEDSPYGRSHQLKGYGGAVRFFEDRKKIELSVIDQLPIDKTIIQNLEYNWDEVFKQVVAAIDI